ncbi:MAG: aspartyl/asparaginyl beta-hydroxylase domain-containing protein [Myxococcota bacterium]|nr:aspartyl/asparaginyl beta-hydroxylase domain-containing protein [Myxococcota bacterium]
MGGEGSRGAIVLGEVPEALLADFEAAVGDGHDWPDNGRSSRFRAQRNTRSLAFREDPTAFESRYAKASAAPRIEDTEWRTRFPEVEPLLELVQQTGIGSEFGKVLAVWLKAHRGVGVHVDDGPYYDAHHRVHVPVVTDPGATMKLAGESVHLERGKIYKIANTEPHGATNRSDRDRLHLIVDVCR